MEMVRNMPESSYELSLKDLVEHHLRQQESASVEKYDSASETSFIRDPIKKRSETRALVTRSRSVNSGGFYLKMFFPMPLGQISTKKKSNLRSDSALNGSSRVSPKPPQVDRDWWRKRSSATSGENSGSVSGSSSSNSNSTSSERSNSRNSESKGSCWFCISPIRSKNPESDPSIRFSIRVEAVKRSTTPRVAGSQTERDPWAVLCSEESPSPARKHAVLVWKSRQPFAEIFPTETSTKSNSDTKGSNQKRNALPSRHLADWNSEASEATNRTSKRKILVRRFKNRRPH
ncbi:hypothetical protein SDJN03_07377, partial [Cucurbita argyrosperma subsp. sororia]